MPKYELREDGATFDTVTADDAESALRDYDLDTSCYDTSGGTIWVDIYAVNADDSDDSGRRTYPVDPPEPDCTEDEHDWQSPHEIVGGVEENPGVQGHGGGIIATEVCMHCGCKRTSDTWAQRPDTGEQGLDSVEYEPGYFEDEVARYRESTR